MRQFDVRQEWQRILTTAAAAGQRPGFTVRNLAAGHAEVTIFGHIGWDVWAEEWVPAFAAVQASTITVLINSPGGSVFDGIAMHDAIRRHPAQVTTVATGLAASAASFILQAGDHRMSTPASTVMIHDALALTVGNAADHREAADLLDQFSGQIAGIYAAAAGQTPDHWRAEMKAERWFTAEAALEAGLVDEVGQPPAQTPGATPEPASNTSMAQAGASAFTMRSAVEVARRRGQHP
jgi:ATP-dependent Clp endopeptidase proteolytic subunit ClpP